MQHWPLRQLYHLLAWLARTWKTMFAYQFVLVAEKVAYRGVPARREEAALPSSR